MPQGLWNPAPENIGTGWPGPPQYNAPNIGSLVGDILKNRQFEQLNMQNQISGLGKAIQAQQQNAAYGEAASNAGLLPGVDTTNMSAAQISDLAQRIQQQGSEASQNAVRQATAKWINANKPLAGPAGTDDEDPSATTRTNPITGALEYATISPRGVKNWHPYSNQLQPSNIKTLGPTQSPEYQLSTKWNLDPEDLYGWGAEYGTAQQDAQGKPASFAPTAPGSGDQPFVRVTKADGGQVIMPRATYEQFKDALTPPQYLGDPNNTAPLPAGPSAPPPAQTGPMPTTAPQTGTGAANPPAVTGIAPDWDSAQAGQAYRAPDGSIRTKTAVNLGP